MNYAAREDAYFRSLDNFYLDQQDFEEEIADRIEAKVIELEIKGEEYDLADLHREVIAEMEMEQADREIERWEASQDWGGNYENLKKRAFLDCPERRKSLLYVDLSKRS